MLRTRIFTIKSFMKSFLTVTAIVEGLTGLALALLPSLVASTLLGTSLTDPAAILIARLAGGALLTITFACWLSRNQPQSSIMVTAMTGYNVFAIALLVYAGGWERISGQGLWPAVIVHSVLLIWGLTHLWKRTG
jgi:hypothetical protein